MRGSRAILLGIMLIVIVVAIAMLCNAVMITPNDAQHENVTQKVCEIDNKYIGIKVADATRGECDIDSNCVLSKLENVGERTK